MEWVPERLASHLSKEHLALYTLIWNRFLASQMAPAIYDQTTIEIDADGTYLLRATGSVLKVRGFLTVYREDAEENGKGEDEEKSFPPLDHGDPLGCKKVTPKQHFTKPPPRYTEATLVRALEEKGIGRPSTYATIVETIQKRKYVQRDKGRLAPTDLGTTVNELLVQNFPRILDVEFTARMEEQLDDVEERKADWQGVLRDFYGPFEDSLAVAARQMRDIKKEGIPTDEVCEKCGKPMVIRWGRYGKFMACSGYPECRNTKEVASNEAAAEEAEQLAAGKTCPECGGPMVVKTGRTGRFLACKKYPSCKATLPLGIGVECPKPECDGEVIERRTKRGRSFFGCSRYPDCDFASWDKPRNKACPKCGENYLVEKYSRDGKAMLKCPQKGCRHKEEIGEGDSAS
jgi:DNA topoisomerase-1